MLATPAIIATISVVDTVTAALGIEAADQAIQSNAKSSGCTASAKTRARAGNGAPSKARKRIGCARVMTGAAMRLDSGEIGRASCRERGWVAAVEGGVS